MSTATKAKDGTVTLTMTEREAAMLFHMAGMGGGSELGVYEALSGLFVSKRGWSLEQFARHATKHKFHEPYVNHVGIIVFDPPGTHGEHNRPHFPCLKRGRK